MHLDAGLTGEQVWLHSIDLGLIDVVISGGERAGCSGIGCRFVGGCADKSGRPSVANDQDRFSYDGRDEFVFRSPERVQFEIITFARTLGCRDTGQPTLEHTWFPGHAWCYCLCGQCGQHLGWSYTGPNDFAGLIKARLVRAVQIRN